MIEIFFSSSRKSGVAFSDGIHYFDANHVQLALKLLILAEEYFGGFTVIAILTGTEEDLL